MPSLAEHRPLRRIELLYPLWLLRRVKLVLRALILQVGWRISIHQRAARVVASADTRFVEGTASQGGPGRAVVFADDHTKAVCPPCVWANSTRCSCCLTSRFATTPRKSLGRIGAKLLERRPRMSAIEMLATLERYARSSDFAATIHRELALSNAADGAEDIFGFADVEHTKGAFARRMCVSHQHEWLDVLDRNLWLERAISALRAENDALSRRLELTNESRIINDSRQALMGKFVARWQAKRADAAAMQHRNSTAAASLESELGIMRTEAGALNRALRDCRRELEDCRLDLADEVQGASALRERIAELEAALPQVVVASEDAKAVDATTTPSESADADGGGIAENGNSEEIVEGTPYRLTSAATAASRSALEKPGSMKSRPLNPVTDGPTVEVVAVDVGSQFPEPETDETPGDGSNDVAGETREDATKKKAPTTKKLRGGGCPMRKHLPKKPMKFAKLTLSATVSEISEVWEKKAAADMTDEESGHAKDTLPEYLEDHYLTKYGVKKLAQTKLQNFVCSVIKHARAGRSASATAAGEGSDSARARRVYLFAVAAGLEPGCEHLYTPLLAHSTSFMLRQCVANQTAKISELLEREPGGVLVQKERAVDGVIGPDVKEIHPETWLQAHEYLPALAPAQSVVQQIVDVIQEMPNLSKDGLLGVDLDVVLDRLVVFYLEHAEAAHKALKEAFFRFDADMSGTLEMEEFEELVASLQIRRPKKQLCKIFKRLADGGEDADPEAPSIVDPELFATILLREGLFPQSEGHTSAILARRAADGVAGSPKARRSAAGF